MAGCSESSDSGGGSPTSDGVDTVKAAWVYNLDVSELGWIASHDESRKRTLEMVDGVEDSVKPPDSAAVFREFAQDHDVIFGTTFGYMDPMAEVSKEYPDTVFEHAKGVKTTDNMGLYHVKVHEARYLAGMAAGMLTETNKIGYVVPFAIGHEIRNINAYTLGARAVNPDVETVNRYIGTWDDPATEREAVSSLFNEDVDVVTDNAASQAAVSAASELGGWGTGIYMPEGAGGDYADSGFVTNMETRWEAIYADVIGSVREDSWESDFTWPGLSEGGVDLSDFGSDVPSDVQSRVEEEKEKMENGEVSVWGGTQFEDMTDRELYFEFPEQLVDGVASDLPES